jgi:hypothetical protein
MRKVSDTTFTRRMALIVILAVAVNAGCRKKDKGALSSMINMADPSTAGQLASGFHGLEQGNWRWTMKKFSVVVKPPQGSEQKGAMLRLRMYISDDQINRLGPVTVSAEVGGQQIEPQTFTKAGENVYSRPVPPEALQSPLVKVNFSLDKAREPDAADGRQLGVVAILIGLTPR